VTVTKGQTTQLQDLTGTPSNEPLPGTVTRLLQRQILPVDYDQEVMPLYVDLDPAILDADKYEVGTNKAAREMNAFQMRQSVSSGRSVHPDQIRSRTAYAVDADDMVSFGTYFNAFPASYWRRYTVVDSVTLTVTVGGAGARVVVYRSTANGRTQQVSSAETEEEGPSVLVFDLTLKPFTDGGWYWYDVISGDNEVVVESAEWTAQVPADRAEHGTVDMAITTMNRPDFCAKLLSQMGDDEVLRPYLDTVFVMEQGNQKVVDSEFFPAAEKSLDGLLRVVEQGNLGGSGGYARGQLESLRKGTATYMMCMDDDVICEPEGIVRAVTFGDLCRRPTLVGGHMFNIYARSQLHSFGEVVSPWTFWWGSAPGVFMNWDFASRNLRSARWLHRRVDVDYNGWFMCLIPRQVLEEIGLSLPVFIKWDDSEYGLRAKEAGYPTVSFPGAAVWHVPWTDKNDGLDWQAYFHHRNRFVAALLHSIYPRGGRMVQESFNHQIKHLASMQYSTAWIRHQALLDVLAGPDQLHDDLPTKLAEIKELASGFQDAHLEADRDAFPPVRRHKPPRKGRGDDAVPRTWEVRLAALKAPLKQLKRPRPTAKVNPEAELPAMDSQWYRIVKYDSVVVSMPDGQTQTFLQRDPEQFKALLKDTVAIHAKLKREWPRLAKLYRDRLGDITSPEAWERTFAPWTDAEGAVDRTND
jgi:galactofuranosylgalactofuranosylrhamnosyl-N-acetylglucosaminyl-diphospho-decaprenol beta-1,5/1,6-galactofuranosyltransferase